MIRVSSFGKIRDPYCLELVERISKLVPFEWNEVKLKRSPDQRPSKLLLEEEKFLSQYKNFICLDMTGKAIDDKRMYQLCFEETDPHFVIGPAVGFHPDFLAASRLKISLSSLTFTHGLAQSVLAESIYRAACTLRNHPFVK